MRMTKKKSCPSPSKKNPSCSQGIQQTLLFPAVGPMAGVGLGPSVLRVSTSSVPLLQLSKVTSSVPRAAPPPSDQEGRDGSAAALRPRGVEARFGQRKGEFVPLPHVRVGQEGTSPKVQELKRKNKMKEEQAWGRRRGGSVGSAESGHRSGSLWRSRPLLGAPPPRPRPGIAEEGPAGCRGRPRSGIAGQAAGSSYLVLCSSSRSQVGSVCPILYRSLESSMLWSL